MIKPTQARASTSGIKPGHSSPLNASSKVNNAELQRVLAQAPTMKLKELALKPLPIIKAVLTKKAQQVKNDFEKQKEIYPQSIEVENILGDATEIAKLDDETRIEKRQCSPYHPIKYLKSDSLESSLPDIYALADNRDLIEANLEENGSIIDFKDDCYKITVKNDEYSRPLFPWTQDINDRAQLISQAAHLVKLALEQGFATDGINAEITIVNPASKLEFNSSPTRKSPNYGIVNNNFKLTETNQKGESSLTVKTDLERGHLWIAYKDGERNVKFWIDNKSNGIFNESCSTDFDNSISIKAKDLSFLQKYLRQLKLESTIKKLDVKSTISFDEDFLDREDYYKIQEFSGLSSEQIAKKFISEKEKIFARIKIKEVRDKIGENRYSIRHSYRSSIYSSANIEFSPEADDKSPKDFTVKQEAHDGIDELFTYKNSNDRETYTRRNMGAFGNTYKNVIFKYETGGNKKDKISYQLCSGLSDISAIVKLPIDESIETIFTNELSLNAELNQTQTRALKKIIENLELDENIEYETLRHTIKIEKADDGYKYCSLQSKIGRPFTFKIAYKDNEEPRFIDFKWRNLPEIKAKIIDIDELAFNNMTSFIKDLRANNQALREHGTETLARDPDLEPYQIKDRVASNNLEDEDEAVDILREGKYIKLRVQEDKKNNTASVELRGDDALYTELEDIYSAKPIKKRTNSTKDGNGKTMWQFERLPKSLNSLLETALNTIDLVKELKLDDYKQAQLHLCRNKDRTGDPEALPSLSYKNYEGIKEYKLENLDSMPKNTDSHFSQNSAITCKVSDKLITLRFTTPFQEGRRLTVDLDYHPESGKTELHFHRRSFPCYDNARNRPMWFDSNIENIDPQLIEELAGLVQQK